jgi:tripartite-type tricarboxylate transporter receptor subunit TctC
MVPETAASRRRFIRSVVGVGAGVQLTLGRAGAACGIGDTIRWVVPTDAGGGYDAYSRLLQPFVERELGVSIQIDNQAGAGGLRGAREVREAAPDGATLGIVNMPLILTTAFTGDYSIDPVNGFTLLGTIARSSYVLATSASSEIRSIDDVISAHQKRGLLFGVASLRHLSFLLPALASSMLGWRSHFVAGYNSSADRALAAMRGEVDLVALSWEVLVDRVQAGDLRPVLAISPEVAELDPLFAGVPSLTGDGGLISRFAPDASGVAAALVRLMGAGRVIVAPPGLDGETADCLNGALCRALQDPAMAALGLERGLRVQALCAADTQQSVLTTSHDVRQLAPDVRAAFEQARR